MDSNNNQKLTEIDFDITLHEIKVIKAYHSQPNVQFSIDRLLGIENDEKSKKKILA